MTDKKDDLFEAEDDLFKKPDADFDADRVEPSMQQTDSSPSFVTEGFAESKASGKAAKASKAAKPPMDAAKKKKFKMIGIAAAVVLALGGSLAMNMGGKPATTTAKKAKPAAEQTEQQATTGTIEQAPAEVAIADPFATPTDGQAGAVVADQFAQNPPAGDPFATPPADPFGAPVDPTAQPGAQATSGAQFVEQNDQFVMAAPATQPGDQAAPTESVYSPQVAQADAAAQAGTNPAPTPMVDPNAANQAAATAALRQAGLMQNKQIADLQKEIDRLTKELAAAQQTGSASTTGAPSSNDAEVKSLKRQVSNLQKRNAELSRIAKRSTNELEKVAKGEESDVVIAYRKASGIEPTRSTNNLLTVKAISNDLAIVQKGSEWHYVKQGDSIDGIYVKSVNPLKGIVVTNQGTFSAQ